jgi:hypothetical protein
MWKRLTGLTVALLVGSVIVFAQTAASSSVNSAPTAEQGKPSPAKAQFFGGAVVEIDQQHIKVSRTLVGRPIETRIFHINASTKMNTAAVRVKARVTVRYRRLPEGDIALEIELRPAAHSSKTQ